MPQGNKYIKTTYINGYAVGGNIMNINEIEKLTFSEVLAISVETMEIKGHQIIIADLGKYFGLSALVFKNEKHVYYANEYELHNRYLSRESGRDSLKEYYIKTLNDKLFTDNELMEDVKSYGEYTRKEYFLRNYWIMRYDYKSAFRIGKAEEKELEEAKKIYSFYNPVSFCYVKDEEIIKKQVAIWNHLNESYEQIKSNDEIFKQMIASELANHEAGYTGSYKSALDALGLNFDELTEPQKKIVIEELNRQIENT